MSSKFWDEITYPFPNVNGGTVEIWDRISNFIPHIAMHLLGDYFLPSTDLRYLW